ncbi:zonular occludens toxin domain-containing protein [Vogesella sp. GCM10023246]|uniref:Zonular occludens toxin domain-containing protein n=1 Tax=Vogesella oryzagri TaxID=3160864 RepID=A0ABV1M749_9NEIS
MAWFIAMGTLGSGKTSWAVSRALRYLNKNRRVAANFPLDFTGFDSAHKDSYATILPDIPTSADLHALGRGGPNERESGLLIIDEGAFVLNARTYNDPDRIKLIEWFALSRKLGWDVILIIQHIQALDKQIRLLFAEHVVICKRMDKLKLGGIIPLPPMHLAVTKYGSEQHAPIAARDFYFPAKIGKAYDTAKLFSHDGASGMYCTLTPHLAVRRYLPSKPTLTANLLLPLQLAAWLGLMVVYRTTSTKKILAKLELASC